VNRPAPSGHPPGTAARALRAFVFGCVAPGTLAGWLPVYLAGGFAAVPRWGAAQWTALPLIAAGAAALVHAFAQFVVIGFGTPFHFDAPKRLVLAGLYRWVRNPMYVAVTAANAGWALLFASRDLAAYAALVWLGFHLFVVFVEEPALRARFGPPYDAYQRAVPRWLPRPPRPAAP